MEYQRIVDLSRVIHPGQEERQFDIEMHHHVLDRWYIAHTVTMMNHIGTHIEVPYHCVREGADLAQVPLDQLIGEAIVLDFSDAPAKTRISLEQLLAAVEKAGGMKKGDIVFLRTGFDRFWDTPQYVDFPYLEPKAMRWLVEQGMKLMGVDAMGAEIPQDAEQTNHHILFENGISLIENLVSLDQLTRSRVMVFALPVAVERLESFPLRVIALE